MAITFSVATTSGTTSQTGLGGNGTLSTPMPAGWAAGDFALLVTYHAAGVAATPTNWTKVTGAPWGTATPKLYAFYTFTTAGTTDPVAVVVSAATTTNDTSVGGISCYRGVSTTTPIEIAGTAGVGTGTPMTAVSITTTMAGDWVLGLCGRGDNEVSGAQVLGATAANERFDAGTNTGSDAQVSLYDLAFAVAGASGLGSSDTSATDPYVSVLIALQAAAVSAKPQFLSHYRRRRL